MIILCLIGPLQLLTHNSVRTRLFGLFSLIIGLTAILLIKKRGAIIALFIMLLAYICCKYKLLKYIIILPVIIAFLGFFGGVSYHGYLSKDKPSDLSILLRIEMYPYAINVIKHHPLFGIGYRSLSHGNYLSDYKQYNKELNNFKEFVLGYQTLDNLYLDMIVEFGIIITIIYIAMILYIVITYCIRTHPFINQNSETFLLLLPLLGIAVHSLSYDSLMFPQINWLFHVHLGLLAGYVMEKQF